MVKHTNCINISSCLIQHDFLPPWPSSSTWSWQRESFVWCGVTGILVIHLRSCEHPCAHDVSPVLKWPEKQGTVLLKHSQKLLEAVLETPIEFLKGAHVLHQRGQNQTPPHVPAHCNAHLVSDTMDILEIESLEEAFSLEIAM